MKTFAAKITIAVAALATPLATSNVAAAFNTTGYGSYSEVIYTGIGFYSVSYEVFVNATYSDVNPGQVQILAGDSNLRGCLKNAQSFYDQTGFVSTWTRGWYIYSDSSGEIDSDNLAGSTGGFWPSCSGSYDWMVLAVTGQSHWPPSGTRVEGRTAYCIARGAEAGCSGYRSTFSDYMY